MFRQMFKKKHVIDIRYVKKYMNQNNMFSFYTVNLDIL